MHIQELRGKGQQKSTSPTLSEIQTNQELGKIIYQKKLGPQNVQFTRIPLDKTMGHYNLPLLKEFRPRIQTNQRAQTRKLKSYQTSHLNCSSIENHAVSSQTYLFKLAHRSHRALKAN